MPNCFAMAFAVSSWSPVIITGMIPACMHAETAFCFAPWWINHSANPIKVNEDSISSTFKVSGNARISFMASQ
jgi:hypothetical protein